MDHLNSVRKEHKIMDSKVFYCTCCTGIGNATTHPERCVVCCSICCICDENAQSKTNETLPLLLIL